jgi:hypothetical protein
VLVAALCGRCRGPAVEAEGALALKRVVIYRNGIGYFERRGRVEGSEVRFQVQQREVGDFLATLAVMERGGSSVRAAAFPMPDELAPDARPRPLARRTVRVALDGAGHDLIVGYTVETPIWRPSYRLVFSREGRPVVQAWGIVQNLSGEDWREVTLSLVAGAPVTFRSELADAMVPPRPLVTDRGAVIDQVPQGEVVLSQTHESPAATTAPGAVPAAAIFGALSAEETNQPITGDTVGDSFGYGGLGAAGSGWGGGGTGEGTLGMGSIGTMGHGSGTGTGQGYGSGAGRGLRDRGTRSPTVRAAPPSVTGLLSPDAIRRVVLRNLGQVNYCYEQGLATNPNIAGRVAVRFIIGGTGTVMASNVSDSSIPVPSVGQCIANAVRRWQFPAPEGGGIVNVNYPFDLQPPYHGGGGTPGSSNAPPPPSANPRNLASLAAVAVQGGTTRYDLPHTVTIPDRSATMVMLVAREVPGEQRYLFAPDPGVPDSNRHPFHVARFENRTGGMLERGPVAIFEAGAYLGQGMLEPLPDGASATVPFALERALVVDSSTTRGVEGERLVRIAGESLVLERYNVQRVTWRARNGMGTAVRLLVRQALAEAERLFEPPAGTEAANGASLAPMQVPANGHGELVLTARAPFTVNVPWESEDALRAVEAWLRDGHPAEAAATVARQAVTLEREVLRMTRESADAERRRDTLQRNAEETRANLLAIQRNPGAGDLRAQLTARLGRMALEIDQLTRRVVELDTQRSEARVRFSELVRELTVDAPPVP